MFEKEAEEFAEKKICQEYNDACMGFDKCKEYCERYHDAQKCWKDGAEFGYNKANEWHYVKDGDFPEEGELVLCATRGYCGVASCATARLYIGYDDKVRRWWTNAGEGKSEQLTDVYAWKEIVLPELKESE